MSSLDSKPLICVVASLLEVSQSRYLAHATGQKNIDAVQRFADCVPMILPALGARLDAKDLVSRIDGLMLTGGRANVQPHHYEGPAFPDDEPIDPARDATVLPLIQESIAAQVPIFGVCRGIQELNVALGGSLHYRLHLLPDKNDHRMPRHEEVTEQEIFALRHTVSLSARGSFTKLVGADEVMVNSLHGQGIDRLADGLEVEAMSPDGVIEGVRLKSDRTFTVGVQWHAEWKPEEHALSRALFREFGDAARERARKRCQVYFAGSRVITVPADRTRW